MKPLILFYSYGGNTKSIVRLLSESLNCDSAEIEPITPYTGSYDAIVNQGQQEVERGYMPPLRPLAVNLRDYDTIFLGSPVWWYTFAPAVKTFLSQNDLAGKTVIPFCTNGGWPGHLLKDVKLACPGASVKPGLNIRFEGSELLTPRKDILEWAKKSLT